jgi:UDP-perosamine 4-acetyltransferase
MSNLPAIILGAGGHAKVLIDLARLVSMKILGITDPATGIKELMDVPVLGGDEILDKFSPDEVVLINAVGSAGRPDQRKKVFEKFKSRGYTFPVMIHPSAVIAEGVSLSEGVQVMAGVVIQTSVMIGENTLINTRSSIDHDSIVGKHVHLAPGVTLSGNVGIGDNVHVGTGSSVIQGIKIGSDSVIGAGSVVVHDVVTGTTVTGVPAREK